MEQARQFLSEQQYDQALKITSQFMDSQDEDEKFEALNITGIIYMEQKRSDLALSIFDQMLAIDSKFADAHFKRAAALDELGRLDEAFQEYMITIDQQYMIPECYFYRGIICQKQKKLDEALQQYNLAINNKDNRSGEDQDTPSFDAIEDIHFNQVTIYMTNKQYDLAIKITQQMLIFNPLHEKAHFLLGKCYQNTGNYDDALKQYGLCLMKNPDYTSAVVAKGQALKEIHKYDEALQVYENFIQRNPSNIEIVNEKGGVLFQQGKYDQALVCFEVVLSAPKGGQNTKALNNKGLALKHMGRNEEAVKCLRQVIEVNPLEVDALINLGSLLDDLHKYDEAILAFDQAIKLNPLKADTFNNKGITLRNLKQLQASLECFEKATQLDEHYILGFCNKAQVEQQLGLGPQALISLQKSSDLLKDPVACKNLNDGHVKYIQVSVEKILNLQEKFHDQAVQLEKALTEIHKTEIPPEQKLVLEEYKELKKQKEEYMDTQYKKIQKPEANQASPEKQSAKVDPVVEMLMQQIAQMSNLFGKMQQDYTELKKEVSDNKERIEVVVVKQDEIVTTLRVAGIYDIVKIKEGWDFYQKDHPELYDYTKAFYWTLLNYFDAYRISSTGAVQINEDHTENKNQGLAVQIGSQVLEFGAQLASNLPIVGNIIGAMNQAITAIYGLIKSKRFEDRINAINRIIMLNHDLDAQTAEDQSRTLAQAALEIADRKRQIIDGKIKESLNPQLKGSFQKAMDFIKEKVSQLQAYALGEKIELYTSVGGLQALEDVMLLLIYFTSEHDEIIEASRSQKLYLIISDSVIHKKSHDLVSEMTMDEEEKNSAAQANVTQVQKPIKTESQTLNKAATSAKVIPFVEPDQNKKNEPKADSSCCLVM